MLPLPCVPGHRVMLEDVLPSRLREALEVIPSKACPERSSPSCTVEDAVREADLVIDFVPDELESKLEIVCMADRMAPPKTVLCIQTSALSVTDLASCTYRDDRCIGVAMLPSGVQGGAAVRTRRQQTLALIQRFFQSCGMQLARMTRNQLELLSLLPNLLALRSPARQLAQRLKPSKAPEVYATDSPRQTKPPPTYVSGGSRIA